MFSSTPLYMYFGFVFAIYTPSSLALKHVPYLDAIRDVVKAVNNANRDQIKNDKFLDTLSYWKEILGNLLNEKKNAADHNNVSEQCSFSLAALQLGLTQRETWALQSKLIIMIWVGGERRDGLLVVCLRLFFGIPLSFSPLHYFIIRFFFGGGRRAVIADYSQVIINICIGNTLRSMNTYIFYSK